MKEMFDEHRDRLTDAEDRRVWMAIHGSLETPRKRWTWLRVPAVLAGAAVVALVMINYAPRLAREQRLSRSVSVTTQPINSPKVGNMALPPAPAGDKGARRPASGLDDRAGEHLRALPYINSSGAGQSSTTPTSTPVPGSNAKPPVSLTTLADKARAVGERKREPTVPVQEELGSLDLPEGATTGIWRDKETTVRQRVSKEQLESLPVDTYQEAINLKASAAGQGGEIRGRGGRGAEAQAPLSGATAPVAGVPYMPPGVPPRGPSPYPNSVGGSQPVNGQAFDAMFFEHYGVNPFIDSQEDALATFAVDVDNASWTMTRSHLERGALPPKEAVRVEEFVNAFQHDYRAPRPWELASREYVPSEKGTFAIYLDAAPSPFGKGLTLLRVGLKGREVNVRDRKPAVLTFVIDVSGSMQMENRLELVKRALFLLLDQMNKGDEVALVTYNTTARVVLPHTSLRDRRRIEAAISMLRPDGSTNADAGLRLGYELADRAFRRDAINRIILCSDGVANEQRTAAEEIFEAIGTAARRGIELTAVGFGMGNYNDVLLEKLADQGNGNYYYVDDIDEARRVFVENLTGTLQTIARQVKIQVEFDPDVVRRYRQLGYENRAVADRDFRNDKVDAGEVGAGHEVTALFEVKLERQPRGNKLAMVRIRYEDPETHQVTEEARAIRLSDIQGDIERCDPTFEMDAAVAEFAEILRHSYWAQDGDFGRVERLARNASRGMEDREEIEEFVRLVRMADRLWPREAPPEWRDDRVRPMWEPGSAEEDGRR